MSNYRTDPFSRYLVIGIASVIALAVVAVLVISNRPRQSDASHLDQMASVPRGVRADTGLPFIGEPDAPVTMLIYEDLGCPNCRNFYNTVEPQVFEDFIVDGKVVIEVYTLAFVNSQSLPAAEGAACALDQNRYWEYRDAVFNNQGVRQFNRNNLIQFARELDMDVEAFSECFDLGTHTREIMDRSQTAYDFGITGTPTSEINGVRYVGVVPYVRAEPPGIQLILEQALSQSQ